MNRPARHRWRVTPREAIAIQQRLRRRVTLAPLRRSVHLVAGADLAIDEERQWGVAGIIVYQWSASSGTLHEIERASTTGPIRFPYIPGLLSFRELPLLLRAYRKLHRRPDLLICDGQGIAHPRGLGIASHLGVLLDLPTIGCAKSRLIGSHRQPGERAGSFTPLHHGRCRIGSVVRSRTHVRPLFVSPGHGMTLAQAVRWTLDCCDGYRLPKPTREADRFVAQLKRRRNTAVRRTDR